MNKGILLAALLLVTGAASAADFSAVGSSGVEAMVDYSYARSQNTPYWSSTHVGLAGLQFNAGVLGSLAVEGGDTQRVGDFRLNYTTFDITYANGFKVGRVNVVGGLSYAETTSDKWFLDGNNSSLPISTVTGTVELNTPVTSSGKVLVFADYDHSVSWSGNLNSFYDNAPVVTTARSNGGAVGLYYHVTKNWEVTGGYTRTFDAVKSQGALASLSYSFL